MKMQCQIFCFLPASANLLWNFNEICLESDGNLHIITMKLVLIENCDLLETALLFSLKVKLNVYLSLMENGKNASIHNCIPEV